MSKLSKDHDCLSYLSLVLCTSDICLTSLSLSFSRSLSHTHTHTHTHMGEQRERHPTAQSYSFIRLLRGWEESCNSRFSLLVPLETILYKLKNRVVIYFYVILENNVYLILALMEKVPKTINFDF